MAEKDIKSEMAEEAADKTPKAELGSETAAPVEDKTKVEPAAADPAKTPETEGEAPDGEDISELITLLNEIQSISGGEGEITGIPDELKGVLGFMTGKLIALRDAFKDPLFKAVLDDMVDQQEDGTTPSALVAFARNAPMEELQELAEKENYADVQGAVDERIASEAATAESEAAMMANYEESQAAGQAYADKMGYDDKERTRLFNSAMVWFKALGDGKLSEAEWEKVDKADNYDKDMEQVRTQIPAQPKKEALPDQASMDAAVKQTPKPVKTAPINSVETMATASEGRDYINVGKRKFMNKQ